MDWGTVANVGTAGGTLVLALATFGATRSANRTARLTEKAMQLGLEPLLTTARPEDPSERVSFQDNRMFVVPGGSAAVESSGGNIYFAIPVRNVGNGIAVLKSWSVIAGRVLADEGVSKPADFRMLSRDLYIPAGGTGFWQGAIRDADDWQRPAVDRAVGEGEVTIDVRYQDHYAGHPAVTRFFLRRLDDGSWFASVVRHFAIDAA
ncbi:MAG: hypothetical protein QOI55_1806 [Actinomycetota bacterium]|nr:hypothetical protein [Actinomycetota bacterium]